ncbi:hypothetical protein [Salipaludibacillus aurantiacus]|uniref:Uncharacterized protein n=1 Tax=Salipaludibacillus aurantiacus TaxID=1601833 RepID=A0A1H9Q679_9BACI|nr:hypothetical protein [Salipaludibacillus aurantiacus]SER55419.1 hypothetical protein SAMN05518684_10240 [Salipaludibacillus aurantiacus]
MKIFKSRKSKLTYQITLFIIFLGIGFLLHPSELANMLFLGAGVGAICIVDTALSNQKVTTRIGVAIVLGVTFFLLTSPPF